MGLLLAFGLGLLLGFLLFGHPRPKQSDWSVKINMDIVSGASYPLTVTVTRKGKAVALPAGANIVWGDSPVGSVTVDPNDQTKATLVGGTVGATGTATATVNFTDPNTQEPVSLNVASGDLTVVEGVPDGGSIDVGAELP
jgi:hypothetical protein